MVAEAEGEAEGEGEAVEVVVNLMQTKMTINETKARQNAFVVIRLVIMQGSARRRTVVGR